MRRIEDHQLSQLFILRFSDPIVHTADAIFPRDLAGLFGRM